MVTTMDEAVAYDWLVLFDKVLIVHCMEEIIFSPYHEQGNERYKNNILFLMKKERNKL